MCPSIIAVSLDMLYPNFVSLMCIHASTQELRALLDKGVGSDEEKNEVCIFVVKVSVSVHICLVCIVGSLSLCAGHGIAGLPLDVRLAA